MKKLASSVTLLLMVTCCDAARILVMPVDHHSEVNLLAMAGQAAKGAGHEVWLLTTPRHKATIEAAGLNPILVAPTEKSDGMALSSNITEQAWGERLSFGQLGGVMSVIGSAFNEYIYEILEDDNLMRQLMELKIDLFIADGFPVYLSSYLVPYYLGVPYLSIMPVPGMWLAGTTGLPSVEPSVLLSFSNQMSFLQRVGNTLAFLGFVASRHVVERIQYIDEERLKKLFSKKPPSSLQQLQDDSSMWLVNFEPVCFDYPRVSAPNYRFIGGASAKPPKALPDEISQFVATAPHGVIVMTFGSIPGLAKMPTELLLRFMAAFTRLDQRVIIRQKEHQLETVPDNVRIMKWVPQNDILGHANTKLFITHGGSNGQMEALYHAVPTLVMPVTGDQEYSAQRAVFKGYGQTLQLWSFTSDELYLTIQELLSNKSYYENIKRCSEIVKSLPSPAETVSFWVDHVLKFGGDHLRNPGLEMPLYQFLCLDIVIFLQIVFITVCVFAFCCCRFMYRKCCKWNTTSTKSKSD